MNEIDVDNALARTANHARIETVLASLHASLERRETIAADSVFTPDALAVTSHLGRSKGGAEIAAALGSATPDCEIVRYRLTNSHVAVHGRTAVQSAYLLGMFANETPSGELDAFMFGGHYAIRYTADASGWRITELRFDLDWQHGSSAFAPAWVLADSTSNWRPEWKEPAVSAELDSPWRAIPKPDGVGTVEAQVQETYIRYAWALDQADFELLATAFTEDAKADMSPFGKMEGRRLIVASLKALREGQPYMQHAAPEMSVDIDGDSASMRIYRAVPFQRTRETLDAPIYGAHYESRLRREDGMWKFEWLRYYPGWVTGPTTEEAD